MNSGRREGIYELWKKRQAIQERYKNVIMLKKNIRKVEAQIELILDTAVKDIKKCSYKDINN